MLHKSRPWRWLLLALLVIAGVGFLVSKALGPKVPVLRAERKPLVQRVVATGRVMPPARIHLGSTVLGKAVTVIPQQGDKVKAGTVLVQLDDAEAKATVAQARASLAQAEARLRVVRQVSSRLATEGFNQASTNLEQAERQFKRVEALAKSGAVPQEQLDDARRALDNARSQQQSAITQVQSTGPAGSDFLVSSAGVSQAQAALAGAQARLDLTRIAAPVEGLVLSRSVEPGDVVQPGKVLLVLARDGQTELVVTPDEKQLAWLRVGQLALASAEAFPEQRFDAIVDYIAPVVDPDRGTVEVKLKVPKPPEYLRADMTVSVDIEVGRRSEALVLPAEAVRDPATDRPWVLLLQDNRLVRRDVKLGLRTEGVLEILEGLVPGELVVPVSAGLLTPGSRARPLSGLPEVQGAV